MGQLPARRRLVASNYPPEQKALVDDLNPFLTDTGNLLTALTFGNMPNVDKTLAITVPARLVEPTSLAGAWSALTTIGYYKDAGRVWLQGILTGGTYGTSAIFTLPETYWPAEIQALSAAQSSLFEPAGRVTVSTIGRVIAPTILSVQSGASTYLSLDGLSFPAADPSPVAPGSPFPFLISTNALGGPAKSLLVLSCQDVTSGSPVAAPYPGVAWVPVTGGVQITQLAGLLPERRYKVRFIIFPF